MHTSGLKKIFLTLALLVSFSFVSFAQCREFTEQELIPQLGDYLLNGRYHTFKMKEGDEVLIFKTLSSGIKYKFIVGSDQALPQNVIFVVKDMNNNTIFDNRMHNFAKSFEYEPQRAMRLKIYIIVPQLNDPPSQGCVGLVIGMKKVAS